jgi:hypothetical protein
VLPSVRFCTSFSPITDLSPDAFRITNAAQAVPKMSLLEKVGELDPVSWGGATGCSPSPTPSAASLVLAFVRRTVSALTRLGSGGRDAGKRVSRFH